VGELAELQAVHDAVDVAEAAALRARPGPRIPHDVIEEMMDADDPTHDAMGPALDARAGQDVPAEAVRALWQDVPAINSAARGSGG
jgi:hypothetical protein